MRSRFERGSAMTRRGVHTRGWWTAAGLGLLGLALSGWVTACQPPLAPRASTPAPTAPSPQPPASVSPVATPAPPPLPTDLQIVAVAVPATLAIDGELDEWAAHQTSERMVYVALASDKLVLAASLPPGAQGVSLVLTSMIPLVPDIGWISRGGWTHAMSHETCAKEQIPGIEGSWNEGKTHPPEVVAACKKLVARHEAFASAYSERFVRRFALSTTGVKTIDGQAIEGALHEAKNGHIEVQLPLSAMPHMAQAPVSEILVLAVEGDLPTDVPLPLREYDEDPDPRYKRLTLAAPVSYEPFGAIRALVFDGFTGEGRADQGSMAYHPNEPNVVQRVHTPESKTTVAFGQYKPQRLAVVETSAKLYEPFEELGDIKLGLADGSTLVTQKGGKIIAHQGIGEVRGVVRRNDQLHLFTYRVGGFDPFMGTMSPPSWSVVAIEKDGTFAEDIADWGVDFVGDWDAWDADPKPFSDATFNRFGMRGLRKKRAKTVTWRWSDSAKRYVSEVQPKSQTKYPDAQP